MKLAFAILLCVILVVLVVYLAVVISKGIIEWERGIEEHKKDIEKHQRELLLSRIRKKEKDIGKIFDRKTGFFNHFQPI